MPKRIGINPDFVLGSHGAALKKPGHTTADLFAAAAMSEISAGRLGSSRLRRVLGAPMPKGQAAKPPRSGLEPRSILHARTRGDQKASRACEISECLAATASLNRCKADDVGFQLGEQP